MTSVAALGARDHGSTGGASIAGEDIASYWQLLRYFADRVRQALAPDDRGASLVCAFAHDPAAYPSATVPTLASPSRVLAAMLLDSLPWDAIVAGLGGTLRVFEVGCGSGSKAARLDALARGALDRYVGIDMAAHAHWAQAAADQRVAFAIGPADTQALAIPPDTNLIVSESAVEHFAADRAFFARSAAFAESVAHPTLHLHVMPSAASWREYGPHGYRGYTAQAGASIASLFPAGSEAMLVTLGGLHCRSVHHRFIRDWLLPWRRRDRRRDEPERYAAALARALRSDRGGAPVAAKAAANLALIIHARPRSALFARHFAPVHAP